MNVTALTSRLEQRFRDPTNAIVTEAQWLIYLNEAYRDVVNATPFWPFKETAPASLTVNADTAYVALPADVTRVTAVTNATDDFELTPLDGRSHVRAFPDDTVRGVPTHYRVYAGRIYVYPTPSSATVLTVEYPAPPAELALGADEPVFPEPYHSILVEGALARAYLDDGDGRAANHQAAFDAILGRMLSDLLGAPRASTYPGIDDSWW